jgi:hypothetical protein
MAEDNLSPYSLAVHPACTCLLVNPGLMAHLLCHALFLRRNGSIPPRYEPTVTPNEWASLTIEYRDMCPQTPPNGPARDGDRIFRWGC